jgi:flagellar basal-body rod protein FlgB
MSRSDAIDYLQAGLRATAMRQAAIAGNIANLQTPGYRRGVAAFEQALAEALHGEDAAALDSVDVAILRPGGPMGDSGVNDVSLDQEVADMVQNSAVSKTYLRILGKLMKQMELAVAG